MQTPGQTSVPTLKLLSFNIEYKTHDVTKTENCSENVKSYLKKLISGKTPDIFATQEYMLDVMRKR